MNRNNYSIEIIPGQYEAILGHGVLKLEGVIITTGQVISLTCGGSDPVSVVCWMGYNINNKLSSNLKKITKTICSCCGSANVSCEAIIQSQ